jgi:hypothetical protein
MEYVMFVADGGTDRPWTPEDEAEMARWVTTHAASGKRVFGERLRPVEDATTVRRRGGDLLVTDGPFAETREWIAGFDVLECDSLEEAVAIAAQHPGARFGQIEVRAAWPFETLPDQVEGE